MKTKLLFKVALAALLFTACSSEENQKNSTDNTSAGRSRKGDELAVLQDKTRNDFTKYFRVDSRQERARIITEKGTTIEFNPRELRVNGSPVSGQIIVAVAEYYSRGEMIAGGMPTLGGPEGEVTDETQLAPLFSGGEFFINMTTSEGQQIDEGTPYVVSIPTELTNGEGETPGEMTVWVENTENNQSNDEEDNSDTSGDIKWEEATDEDGTPVEVPVIDDKYVMELLVFGYVNCDKLDQIPGERTDTYVSVPEGYDPSNTKVYISYQGFMNLVTDFHGWDSAAHQFYNTYHNAVIGMNFHVIVYSKQGADQVIAVKQVTIAGNDVITFDASDFAVTTNAALIAQLNSLP